LSSVLDKFTSLAAGDRRDIASKDLFELFVKIIEILDRLRRLLIKLKRDFTSVSPINSLLKLRQIL